MQKDYAPNVEIETNDPAMRPLLRESFTEAANGTVALIDIANRLRHTAPSCRTVPSKDSTYMGVSFSGQRISFDFSTENFKYFRKADNSAQFHYLYDSKDGHSNEVYTMQTANDVERIKGIDSYLGVSGGLSQNLLLLSLLQRRNDIREVNLVDKNQQQLMFNLHQMVAYDADHSRFDPSWHLSMSPYLYMNIHSGTVFHFKESLIEDAVRRSPAGRYFIYSSNIYNIVLWVKQSSNGKEEEYYKHDTDTWWLPWWKEGCDFMVSIMGNERIADGSVYMSASCGTTRTILAEKGMGTMREYSYCDGTDFHDGCVHPSYYLRKEPLKREGTTIHI